MLEFSACYEFFLGLYEFYTNTPGLIDKLISSPTTVSEKTAPGTKFQQNNAWFILKWNELANNTNNTLLTLINI